MRRDEGQIKVNQQRTSAFTLKMNRNSKTVNKAQGRRLVLRRGGVLRVLGNTSSASGGSYGGFNGPGPGGSTDHAAGAAGDLFYRNTAISCQI